MDQRSIISLLNRTRLPATACLLVLVGGVGALGFPRPAHAVAGGIIVPAGGIFDPNNANGTFTYTYVQPIAVAPEAGGDELQTPTCTASGATLGSVGLTSFTFNQGTTTVSCTAPEDDAPPDNVPDTGSFTVIVREFPLTFTNPLLSQTKTADATDTATFTVDFATASEPGETAAELFALSGCKTNDFAQTPLINPVTLHTGRHEYLCMATDTTDNNLHPSLVLVALTVLDERTVLRNPGNQTAFANATDTAVVSYPAVTPSEVPSGESDGQLVGCLAPVPALSTASSPVAHSPSGSPPSVVMPTTYRTCLTRMVQTLLANLLHKSHSR